MEKFPSRIKSSGEVQGRCRALFSYQPANPDELPLSVGDVLDVLGEVEEGWWQGRRQGRVGVFPSNFVEMVDPPQPVPPFEPAPALPPKPFKELCRVLFPYTAVNEDELTLGEGEIVTIVSKEAPDRGWWRGELHGRVGLFPDNFVQLLPAKVKPEPEEKKPDRPPSKSPIYPILNKYSETTSSMKELTTSRISSHKENTINKESSTQSTVTHTNKSESEKTIHNEAVSDGTLDGQIKKPPVPLKKASPTLSSGVGGLFTGLKTKMLSTTEKEKSSSTTVSSGSSSGGEWDRPDGGAGSKPASANANTFDHVERNQMLNDPRARRVKAPRRRPPSQLRDDMPPIDPKGLSNGYEGTEKAGEKADEIRPRTREWEKHKAPWMEELKLNQAKKTSFGADGKARPVSGSGDGLASKAGGGSTDRILDCGLDEKRSSSHSMEMSKSTSSISSKMSIMESFEETKVRHSLDSKKDVTPAPREDPPAKPTLPSPTAAGRTLAAMLDEIKKPPAPQPPSASVRTNTELFMMDKLPNAKLEKTVTEKNEIKHSDVKNEISSITKSSALFEKTAEIIEKIEEKVPEKPTVLQYDINRSGTETLERLKPTTEKVEGSDALIAQLNSRISNLEKLIEVQNSMFNAAIEDLNKKLRLETEKRQELQAEIDKLAHCVTQV